MKILTKPIAVKQVKRFKEKIRKFHLVYLIVSDFPRHLTTTLKQ